MSSWLKALVRSRAEQCAEEFARDAERLVKRCRSGELGILQGVRELRQLHEGIRSQLLGDSSRPGLRGGSTVYDQVVKPKYLNLLTELEVLQLSRKAGKT